MARIEETIEVNVPVSTAYNPAPVLPLLAQPCLLLGRAAHPRPAAGRSLRGYAPPRTSGEQRLRLSTRDRGARQTLSGSEQT